MSKNGAVRGGEALQRELADAVERAAAAEKEVRTPSTVHSDPQAPDTVVPAASSNEKVKNL